MTTPWWGPTTTFAVLGDVDDLPASSRARVERLARPGDRLDVTAAHLAAHAWVDREAPGARIDQWCEGCGEVGHGRPVVVDRPDLGVSWSHAEGWVAVLVTAGPCGVDVERVRERWPSGAFTDVEQQWSDRQSVPAAARTLLWTRKESLVKVGMIELGDVGAVELVHGGHLVDVHESWRLDSVVSAEETAVCSWAVRVP